MQFQRCHWDLIEQWENLKYFFHYAIKIKHINGLVDESFFNWPWGLDWQTCFNDSVFSRVIWQFFSVCLKHNWKATMYKRNLNLRKTSIAWTWAAIEPVSVVISQIYSPVSSFSTLLTWRLPFAQSEIRGESCVSQFRESINRASSRSQRIYLKGAINKEKRMFILLK